VELLRALAALGEPPQPAHEPIRRALGIAEKPDAAAHTDLFTFQLHPYASVFVGEDGMLGGEARERVAGFWRALQLVPPAEPDHLCVLLALYANLREREEAEPLGGARRAIFERSRRALMWEHIAPWAFAFLEKAREVASPFYRAWAVLARDALAVEARDLAALEQLPLHLRDLPKMPDPREDGAEALLSSLLAPARSGLVLVRSDLRRAADDLGLGLRVGERRYVLRALFAQDAASTLRWIENEALAWSQRHAAMDHAPLIVRTFWSERAMWTATLVGTLIRSLSTLGA
jgi:TorA maturation chaperone TorD